MKTLITVLLSAASLTMLFGFPFAPSDSVQQAWVARYDGSSHFSDQARAIALDAAGNVYVTGQSYYNQNVGISFYATIKYNSLGQQQWVANYVGSTISGDEARAIAVSASGDVYVTGKSYGSGSHFDYATIKYNSAGQQQWVARYNGPGNGDDAGSAIGIDSLGNIYVTGGSVGSDGIADYATVKYDSAGQEQWVARYNGTGGDSDEATALGIDSLGNVYVTGRSFGVTSFYDYATIKYNSAGQQQWVARYNGSGNSDDDAKAIVIDGSANVYVTGVSVGLGTGIDYATIKYSSAGQQQWVARYDRSGRDDQASAIALDSSGNVYVTGEGSDSGNTYDYATIKYNSVGQQQWIAYYDGPIGSDDSANAIAVDQSGNVYVTGNSLGSESIADYATIKYDSAGQQQWFVRYRGPGDGGQATAIALDGLGNIYVTGTSDDVSYDYATIKYVQDATPTPTPTATPSGTPRPSPTPRHMPTPKPRPTPAPRSSP